MVAAAAPTAMATASFPDDDHDAVEAQSTRSTSEVLDSSDVAVDLPTLVEEDDDDHHDEKRPPLLSSSNENKNDHHHDDGHFPSCNQLICPSHDYRQLDLFCATCETGICHLCAERSHFEHDVETLVDAIGKERDALQKMADDVEARVPLVEESINQVCVP